MSRTKEVTLIALVSGSIFFFNLGGAKLWDRDEPRNAGCAQEMLERGDLVVPVFNDEIRDAKPVLLYWLIISAYQVFGIGEFGARFWSALLAVGTVFCTYFIGQRLFARSVGTFGAVILATSLMFDVAARAATPDSILIFFSTLALAFFVAGTYPKRDSVDEANPNTPCHLFPKKWSIILLMYGSMALGVLAKGPIGFLMPTAIVGMYLLIMRLPGRTLEKPESVPIHRNRFTAILISIRRVFSPIHFVKTCHSMRLLTAFLTILLIAGPWYFWVGIRTDGEFLKTFFLKEHLGRSTTSFESHTGSIIYYPIVMSIGFFPWSIFALPVIYSLFTRKSGRSPAILLMLCWVLVQVSVFTLVQTKLPSYVTPCYPALSLLVGYHLHLWARKKIELPDWLPRLSMGVLVFSGIAIGGAIGYAAFDLLKVDPWIAAIGIVPTLTGIFAWILWNRHENQIHSVHGLLAGAVVFSLLFFGVILQSVSREQRYDQLLSESSKPAGERLLGAYGCLEPTWVFYGRQPIFELTDSNERVDLFQREKPWHAKARPGVAQFLSENGGQVITTSALVPKIESLLGRRVTVLTKTRYFLKDEDLVLVRDSRTRDPMQTKPTDIGVRDHHPRRMEVAVRKQNGSTNADGTTEVSGNPR